MRDEQHSDEGFMRRAMELARCAWGQTNPNPMVGAVIVSGGRVVGEGYHHFAGGAHAEVEALAAAGDAARGATLYVNLEPCNHHGRTPPCVDAILAAGLSRVVYGSSDPGAASGGGGERLAKAGVAVTGGVLRLECDRLNEAFLKHARTGVPFVILKSGMTLDGRIAGAGRQREQITGREAQREAHRLRAYCDAIMVGIDTVLADDPRLDVRDCEAPARAPLRVVIDSHGRLPLSSALVRTDPRTVLVAVGASAPQRAVSNLRAEGVRVERHPTSGKDVDLRSLMHSLGEEGVASILAEGGSRITASLVRLGLADKLVWFIAPVIAGGDAVPVVGPLGGEWVRDGVALRDTTCEPCGVDLRIEAYFERLD